MKRVQRNKAGVYTCHVDVRVGSPITQQFNVYVKGKHCTDLLCRDVFSGKY